MVMIHHSENTPNAIASNRISLVARTISVRILYIIHKSVTTCHYNVMAECYMREPIIMV